MGLHTPRVGAITRTGRRQGRRQGGAGPVVPSQFVRVSLYIEIFGGNYLNYGEQGFCQAF